MTNTCHSALEALLFNGSHGTLVNIKLLRGDDQSVTKEEICEEIHSALVLKRAGKVETHEDFPDGNGAGSIRLADIF